MKLTRLEITNTLGVRRFAADLSAPLQLIAGRNGAGKSSLLQAVRMALTGAMPRVSLKKDAHQLVSDGAKTGSIGVTWDGGEAVVTLPDCKLSNDLLHPAMPYLCDMHAFSALDDKERRAFLFGLTGTKITGEEVQKRLLEKGADPQKVEAVIPLMRSGFPAAQKEAANNATLSKGAWKAVTGGETYGAKKAADWRAAADNGTNALVAADLPGLRADLAKLNADLDAENQALGRAVAQQEAAARAAAHVAGLRQQAGQVERAKAKLDADSRARNELHAVVEDARRHKSGKVQPLTCPDCGAHVVVDSNGQLAAFTREPGDDTGAEAADRLPEYERSLDLMDRAVANASRDLAAAQAAAAQLADAEKAAADAPAAEDVEARRVLVADIKKRIAGRQEEIAVAEAGERAAADAEKRTQQAARHHADVAAWELIADALAPDGIPGELLAQALTPINTALAQHAADTGWPPVTIDAEMALRYGGRPLALISESEQWRADAMLTVAVAQLSGVRLALLDRLDVLDLAGRSEALGWFAVLADEGDIDTLIVAGTLKQLPASLPDTYQAHWIDSGSVAEPLKAVA